MTWQHVLGVRAIRTSLLEPASGETYASPPRSPSTRIAAVGPLPDGPMDKQYLSHPDVTAALRRSISPLVDSVPAAPVAVSDPETDAALAVTRSEIDLLKKQLLTEGSQAAILYFAETDQASAAARAAEDRRRLLADRTATLNASIAIMQAQIIQQEAIAEGLRTQLLVASRPATLQSTSAYPAGDAPAVQVFLHSRPRCGASVATLLPPRVYVRSNHFLTSMSSRATTPQRARATCSLQLQPGTSLR